MGVTSDDAVLIEKGKKPGEPHIITVNCPDKTGLACDICNIILDFGLYITKGDVSTDGIWCFIVFWVVPHSRLVIRWTNLKNRLLSICPPCSMTFYYIQPSAQSSSSLVYLLKFCSLDRKGLLHDVTQVLGELELTIQRVKVTTTPDGRVLDLFFISDNMELLHTKKRQDETCEQLHAVLGESCISCELQLAGPEYECNQGMASLSPAIAEELFRCEISDKEIHSQALSADMAKLKKSNVMVDNSLSPAHTLLQVHCIDHKGLLYDVMRTLKDCNIQTLTNQHELPKPELVRFLYWPWATSSTERHVSNAYFATRFWIDVYRSSTFRSQMETGISNRTCNGQSDHSISSFFIELCGTLIWRYSVYPFVCSKCLVNLLIQIAYGRFSRNTNGHRDLDLFIRQKDGKKIVDPEKQSSLCLHLKAEMLHPLRVIIANRGPDTELLVANPVELSGKGRPRVFYDVTLALKALGICIFLAEIGRHSSSDREWEVYRFLLEENCKFPSSSMVARNHIADRVRRTLMGW